MATGILGLGSDGASSLNSDLIDKLKEADKTSKIDPIETALEDWDKELEQITSFEEKFNALYDIAKNFDTYSSNGTYFDQKTASTSGSGAIFDAVDVANLEEGNTTVEVTTLAKKDIFQSNSVTEATKDTAMGAETLSIAIGANAAIDFDTSGKTYDELATEINNTEGITASVEQVGDDAYRLVIKSTDTGTANALTISGTASQTLGYTTDGTTENGTNHIQTAENSLIKVDGIEYTTSSNEVSVMNGALTITAAEEGSTTVLSVQKDTTTVVDAINELVTAYNDFIETAADITYGTDDEESYIDNTSSIKSMVSLVKDKMFGTYGENNDLFMGSFGLELQKDGTISINSTTLNDKIANDFDSVQAFFTGDVNYYGMGTELKDLMFDMTLTGGLMKEYGEDMNDRKTDLETLLENETEKLDDKYSAMSNKFAQYAAIITRMESSFSGLKMMIEQASSGN